MNELKKITFYNADEGEVAKCILAGCYKFGAATLLRQNGSTMTSVIETKMAVQNAIELPSELKGKKFRIRKLTPKECFRLMGVADSDIDKIQAKEVGISNSAQYILAGNSIVVDVLFHLFRKMFIETGADKSEEPQQLGLFDL
jgi:site-specific DNA-cytosine methylase